MLRFLALYGRMKHISEEDLELYCLDRIKDEERLAPIEEHLLICHSCIGRAEAMQRVVDTIRLSLEN